jgi:UDP-glucose 6-dehydrogenase
MSTPRIGFIGQGFIGKNYADDFERRGFSVVRYALEAPYNANKEQIRECDIVFIAVPTPTTPEGFDASVVRGVLSLVGKGKTAVLKSTILPGTTAALQKEFSDRVILYSPEFLSESTAAHDAANPFSNIVGLSRDDEMHQAAAQAVLAVLPSAPFSHVCTSTEAELIKYAHNLNGYFQILLSNILYDAAAALGAGWQPIQRALEADTMISNRYIKPVHQSGHPGARPGRGAGGHCFIKDFAAFRGLYERLLPQDGPGASLLRALEQKNIELLQNSGKDLDLLRGVYGDAGSRAIPSNEIIDTHAEGR